MRLRLPEGTGCADIAAKDTGPLKTGLDRLADSYGAAYLETDPVSVVHRYGDPRDREVAGLAVALLSYGGASQIRRSANDLLARTGTSPARLAETLDSACAARAFDGFVHRWTRGGHMARLWCAMGAMLREYGSIGAFVASLDDPGEETVEGLMTRFAAEVNEMARTTGDELMGTASSSPLISSPAGGSACKRLAMYFRWMVRGPDGIDFGLWRFVSPARLIIPLDRHIARMGRRLGLTSRRAGDWKTALQITAALRCLDPADPVRYDFALVRPGIVGQCPPRGDNGCGGCVLNGVCIPGAG